MSSEYKGQKKNTHFCDVNFFGAPWVGSTPRSDQPQTSSNAWAWAGGGVGRTMFQFLGPINFFLAGGHANFFCRLFCKPYKLFWGGCIVRSGHVNLFLALSRGPPGRPRDWLAWGGGGALGSGAGGSTDGASQARSWAAR